MTINAIFEQVSGIFFQKRLPLGKFGRFPRRVPHCAVKTYAVRPVLHGW